MSNEYWNMNYNPIQPPQQGTFPMQAPNAIPAYQQSWANMQQFSPQLNQIGSVGNPITQGNGTFNPEVFGSMAGANGAATPPTGFLGNIGNQFKKFTGMFEGDGALSMGTRTADGWQPSGLAQGLQVGKGLFDSWGAMKSMGLAKKQFNFQKDAFNKQYNNQKQMINTRMEDRQKARNAGNSNTESADSYMDRNRIQ